MPSRIFRMINTIIATVKRCLFYSRYDSSEYWKLRASCADQAAVLWRNDAYNRLYRIDQEKIIRGQIENSCPPHAILDIGCGIGVVAKMISRINPTAHIDAVDFEEMIRVAMEHNPDPRIAYIAASAESFNNGDGRYDMIISSGCYSAIRDITALEKALNNASVMIKTNGKILMIDPFHRWNYLARAKYGTNDVIKFMNKRGLTLMRKSGILFWPFRVMLANSVNRGLLLKKRYRLGERLLRILGQHFWADYKILVFIKK
jgi:ubiquinone/menaquinone biosynthesis C-methylase UbiE